ncbi:hypothetical protein ACHAWF_018098 [Thalassiosira exigua]
MNCRHDRAALRFAHLVVVVAFFVLGGVRTAHARSTLGPKPKASIVAEKRPDASKPVRPKKWLEVCNRLAPATSVLCSLAPLPTILEVSRTKTVGSLPLLPYSSMAANGLVWALYGWLTESHSLKWANVLGTLLGAFYFKEFRKYSPPGLSNLPGTINQHVLVVTWIVLVNAFTLMRFNKQTSADIIGKEGVLMYIILFASPLAAVGNVIATKSADSIPLPFTIASTINCSLWSIVGVLLMNDFYIYFPSIMGLLCALAQLFLKGVYSGGNVESGLLQEMGQTHIHAV